MLKQDFYINYNKYYSTRKIIYLVNVSLILKLQMLLTDADECL